MKKKYRVWRVVINVLGHHLAVTLQSSLESAGQFI